MATSKQYSITALQNRDHCTLLVSKIQSKSKTMRITNIDLGFRLRSLLPRNNAENYVRAKQKYADANLTCTVADYLDTTIANESQYCFKKITYLYL